MSTPPDGAPDPGPAEPDRPSADGARPGQAWPQYPTADPYAALSYIVSGVLVWGLIGWGLARWLDAPVLTGLGLVIGGVLGIVLVYLRYGRPQSGPPTSVRPAQVDPPDDTTPGAPQPRPRAQEEP